uniref:UDP-glycosyltransferases domain-containing protein n=1 Tax=Glycine max TaxID=3847 RepID=K7MF05_SOYBN
MAENAIHVVMLPWSAFGHLIPFFKLSIALAKAGVHVSFISTPKNIQRLPKIPSNLAHLVDLVQFPLPSLDKEHLPEGAEATVDIPSEKIEYLKLAYDKLQHAVKQFVANQLPNWIICDFSPHWIVDIVHEFQVKLIFYNVLSAPALTVWGPPGTRKTPLSPESLTAPPEWVTFPSSVAYRIHEAIALCAGANPVNASGVSDFERLHKVFNASEAVIFRSCYEIEGEYLNAYQKLVGKPVIPIGLLPADSEERGREIIDGRTSGKIFEWLDEQASKSVVFVGFGSELKLNKDQVFEIAYGIEEYELPFIWALRKPSWAINDEDFLPFGFIERTSNRGVVCMGWIPQQEILAHPSIGGSLFHSGWGSVIETLQFGHILVVLPFIIDQPLNARFLVEKGLAIEVKRNEDGSFTRNDIATSLRQAMVLEEGKKIRINTGEAAAIVGNLKLHQDHYIAEFVQFLKNGIRKNEIHVVMLPWSAFGHLIPFFKLSIALAKAGVHVSFISTPKNIQRLPKIPSNLAHLVHFVQLPLPSLDKEHLPEGAEATVDIPSEEIEFLKLAYDKLQHPVKQFVANQLPNWIICDFSPHWIVDIAQEFQVKLIFYSVFSAASMNIFAPTSKSVVFVGFGSELKLNKDQVFEIAYGIEESQLPFLWGLRKPSWATNDEDFLPVGFIERTSNRGVVCMGWIPQQEILAHPSIGGSLFHSGWGSVIETLQFDQPLNARFLVEKGLAIEVKMTEDGSFTRNEIAKSLRQAMVLEEGKKLRINTGEAAAIVGNLKLHQDHYIAAFVQFLKNGS